MNLDLYLVLILVSGHRCYKAKPVITKKACRGRESESSMTHNKMPHPAFRERQEREQTVVVGAVCKRSKEGRVRGVEKGAPTNNIIKFHSLSRPEVVSQIWGCHSSSGSSTSKR